LVDYEWTSPQNLLAVIKALQENRPELLRAHLSGLVTKPELYDFQKDLDLNRRVLVNPFLVDEAFRFTPEFARQVFCSMTSEHPNMNCITIKPWWMAQSRIYWTLYSVLGRLGAEANWFRIAREEAENSAVDPKLRSVETETPRFLSRAK
jgi:hypothetical protein